MANDESIKVAFGEWLATPVSDRRRLKLPTSQSKWAETYGLNSRTLTRWKDDPVVVATVARAKARRGVKPEEPAATETPAEPLAVGEDGLETLERDLLAKALSGNEKAIEQYLKWFGRDELEARRRAQDSLLTKMTNEELVTSTLDLIGVEAVQAWLEAASVGA